MHPTRRGRHSLVWFKCIEESNFSARWLFETGSEAGRTSRLASSTRGLDLGVLLLLQLTPQFKQIQQLRHALLWVGDRSGVSLSLGYVSGQPGR